MRGSVFRIEFRILVREFESIEIFPGFARLQVEKPLKKSVKSQCSLLDFGHLTHFFKHHEYLLKETKNEQKNLRTS